MKIAKRMYERPATTVTDVEGEALLQAASLPLKDEDAEDEGLSRDAEPEWRRLLMGLCLLLMSALPAMAALEAGGEYYIWLNIYEKLVGSNEAGDAPALSAYGTQSDGYVFVAEASGQAGYYLLRQKSSGRYLAASGASGNTWSIVFETDRSTDNRYLWKMTGADCYAYLTNKKNESAFVGVDGANKGSAYVGFYYDKRRSSHGQFSVIPAAGTWDEARQAYQSGDYTNAQGVTQVDYCQLKDRTVDRSDAVDIHITANSAPLQGNARINLGSDRTWLIIDNIVPSQVISTYLKYVTISGAAAQKDVNCRVAIYLNGAAVIPLPPTVMTCDGTQGTFTLAEGNHKDLATIGQSNTMTSFTLRRGYMATLATGTNGSGHSHVFVADHADKVVTLPKALASRVTSVNVKKWQYLSKKGWADTGGATRGPELRATWYWAWNADYSSTSDMEYVPCRQHRYWPSTDQVNSKTATASLSLNEPEHAEQHTSEKCSCGGKIDVWTAYNGYNSTFQAGGGRIGSPQPTDFSYLTQYFKYVDENNSYSRCDFAVTHAYWKIDGRSAADYAKYVTDQCWTIWNNTKRPVWLTEMEVGASWFTDTETSINDYDPARNYLQELLARLEESDYIERYAIYAFDYWRNYMFYKDGGITPAGQVYRDHRSTFAYREAYTKEPAWWAPGVKKPTLTYDVNSADGTMTFTVGNTNGDATGQVVIEHDGGTGSWQTLKAFDGDRSLLEGSTVAMTVGLGDVATTGDNFRVTTTTLYGASATSDVVTGPTAELLDDLATLTASIGAAESHRLGFARGEYAPYANVAVLKKLEEAKALALTDKDFHQKATALSSQLDGASWQQNVAEMDAIFDGRFATTPANATSGDITLPGWTPSERIRLLVKDTAKDPGLAYTDGKAALFAWGATTLVYGEQTGYTMPLAKHQLYELTLKLSGWRDGTLPSKFSVTLDGATQELTPSVKRITDTSGNPFQALTFQLTPTADNSVMKIYCNQHFTIADLSLRPVVTAVTVSVSEAGFATFVSDYDLDFTESGIKAYTAKVDGDRVVLTPIFRVKAGTPVVLYDETGVGTVSVPVAATAEAPAVNQLVAGTGAAVPTVASGRTNYVLNSLGGVTGFYRANSQRVAANRAYLSVPDGQDARLQVVFADEATGVAAVKAADAGAKVYNLGGQRVKSPRRGIYIVGGRTVSTGAQPQ